MKIDLTKTFKKYYQAPQEPQIDSFEAGLYLTIEGKGEPAGTEFTAKVEALYPTAYGIKKICKARSKDFAVPKLEGHWWVDGGLDARTTPRSHWSWKLLIRLPDYVKPADLAAARAEVAKKKKIPAMTIEAMKLENLENGRCVHVLHVGPYSEETATIDRLQEFMKVQNLKSRGFHHEIYLSDPRKTAPKKMKTVLRQTVE